MSKTKTHRLNTHITQTHKESLDSRTSRPLNSRPSATSRVLATDQHLHPTSARERAPETHSQTSDTLSHAHTPRGTPLSGAAHHKPFPCSRAVSRPTRKPSTLEVVWDGGRDNGHNRYTQKLKASLRILRHRDAGVPEACITFRPDLDLSERRTGAGRSPRDAGLHHTLDRSRAVNGNRTERPATTGGQAGKSHYFRV